jgi:arylsulfatase A-like enzyme
MSTAPVLHALTLALLVGASACGPAAREEHGRGVLLIAVDALRADHLGIYGYDRDTSPTLSQLAREGLRFGEVFASAPQLIPAHASLLSGCAPDLARRFLAPDFEGPRERRWRLPARAPHLAIEFLAAGYATAAFSDHAVLSEPFGFERGFQHWEVLDEESAGEWEGEQDTRAVEHFLQWLRDLPRDRSWFAYVNLNELERCWSRPPQAAADEYFQPRPELSAIPPVANTDSVFFAIPRSRWRGGVRSLGQYEAAYDGEIRTVDAEIGRRTACSSGSPASTSPPGATARPTSACRGSSGRRLSWRRARARRGGTSCRASSR